MSFEKKRQRAADEQCVFKSTMYKIAPNMQHYKKIEKNKTHDVFQEMFQTMTWILRLY